MKRGFVEEKRGRNGRKGERKRGRKEDQQLLPLISGVPTIGVHRA